MKIKPCNLISHLTQQIVTIVRFVKLSKIFINFSISLCEQSY